MFGEMELRVVWNPVLTSEWVVYFETDAGQLQSMAAVIPDLYFNTIEVFGDVVAE